jgi:hypothetical protein
MWLAKGHNRPAQKGIREMRVSHTAAGRQAVFDDPNLVSCGGLAPVLALAERCGFAELVVDRLTLPARGGVNAELKASTGRRPGSWWRLGTSSGWLTPPSERYRRRPAARPARRTVSPLPTL